MNRFFAPLGRFVVKFRFVIVLVWIVVLVVSTHSLPSLSSEVNNNNSQFLPASAPSSVASSLATPIFGNSNSATQILVVATTSQGQLTAQDTSALATAAKSIQVVPRVSSAHVVAVSRDGAAAQILINADAGSADIARQTTIVNAIANTLATLHEPAGLQLHLAGPTATNVADQKNSNQSSNQTERFSFIFIVILLLVIFRSILAPLLTLLPAGFALLISVRFIGGLGAHGLKISQITELLLIVLLLGAGTDYGLFLVFRVREEVRRGLEVREAVAHSLARVGESISASAGTVIFALLSLLLATFGIYKDLGLPLAIGVAVMLLAGITLLPALLAIFGRAVFWPARLDEQANTEGAWGRLAGRLVRRPAWTLAIGILIFVMLAIGALGFHSGGFGGELSAPAGTDTAIGNQLLAKHFPNTSVNPANLVFTYTTPIWDHPSDIAVLTEKLHASEKFNLLAGPFNPNGAILTPSLYARLHARLGDPLNLSATPGGNSGATPAQYNAYRATSVFVSADGRTIQFEATLRVGDQSSNAALDATPQIRSLLTQVGQATGAHAEGLAGEAAALYDVDHTSNQDLLHILPLAILAIALLLALVLRSLVAPLYLIISVVLSYLAALGLATILFIDLGGESGLTFILPFLMFIFLLALGEDYNILVMTRIREEAHHRSIREAVVVAVGRTGPTVSAAGLILAGTFGVLAVAGSSGPGGSQIRDIGVGLGTGILMDTFLVRTLLVPSTVALLGRWNWWPAKLGRSVDSHLDSSATKSDDEAPQARGDHL